MPRPTDEPKTVASIDDLVRRRCRFVAEIDSSHEHWPFSRCQADGDGMIVIKTPGKRPWPELLTGDFCVYHRDAILRRAPILDPDLVLEWLPNFS